MNATRKIAAVLAVAISAFPAAAKNADSAAADAGTTQEIDAGANLEKLEAQIESEIIEAEKNTEPGEKTAAEEPVQAGAVADGTIDVQIEVFAEEIPAKKDDITHVAGLDVEQTDYAQSMVRKYMAIYTSEKGSRTLRAILRNGEEYRIFVRKKLAEAGLPRALEYLPVVESEYTIAATSKSGAKGMWQFMENSIKPYLKKNDWIDERLDPWKSTDAAIRKLKENYDVFGDWALALAAYNCGAGAMLKTTRENPDKSFWILAEQGYLKKQTVHYVPKLIAIAELSENPEKYGLDLPVLEDDAEIAQYDFVKTGRPVSLMKIASEMNIGVKTLKRLNPSLVRNVTPPMQGFPLRVPLGTAEIAKKAVEKLQKESGGSSSFYVEHKIISGDTLWGLSRTYGCKVDDICDLNGISQKTILKLGKVLYIPLK